MRSAPALPLVAAIAFLVVGCASPIDRGPVALTHIVIDPAPDAGIRCCSDSLAVGDLDGDGRADVVLGSQGAVAAGLVWFRAPDWRRNAVARGEFTTDARVVDLDGDGRLDILASGEVADIAGGPGVFWFRNPGPAGREWAVERIGFGGAHDLAAADLDGDGRLDVVSCDKRSLRVSTVTPSGEWSTRAIVERAGEGLDIADIDGDGRLDVVSGATWWKTPDDLRLGVFQEHTVGTWPVETRVRAVDVNGDSHVDIVVTVSEGPGTVAWFENPGRNGDWRRHDITSETLEGAHSLQVVDIDGDGDLDIVTAEMHKSAKRRVLLYLQTPTSWQRQLVSTTGSHNLSVADLDGDGDLDIVGKNYAGQPRPVEAWINGTIPSRQRRSMDQWTYVPADTTRPEDQRQKTGLVFADLDHDARPEIIAGAYVYFGSPRPLASTWRRERLPGNPDAYHAADFDHDGEVEILGADTDRLMLIERDANTASWKARTVADLPGGRTQGYALLPSPRAVCAVLTRGDRLLLVEPPPHGDKSAHWTVKTLSGEVAEEGLAVGDIDRDGDFDVAATATATEGTGHLVVWLENPGTPSGEWRRRTTAEGPMYFDRVALADVDRDGRLDIVVTEESRSGRADSHVRWLEAPEDVRHGHWVPHTIARLRSLNSLDVGDVDDDGDVDVVVAEHTDLRRGIVAPDTLTAVYENLENGASWRQHIVDRGPRSSHLGARLVDLDGDGDSDIVSIAWHQFETVHVWRNDAPIP